MTTVVIMPGGFHPFHAGHLALYQAAKSAFPRAEVFVAATNDTSARPFPFAVKEKLAQLAGVAPSHFVQVKSPFRAEEITARFDPKKDRLIFVRSEKDADKPPQPGGVKKDGSPSYLQPLAGATNIRPFGEHAYMAYLPTVEFGPGMTSATEIRSAWPQLNDQRKRALVMSLYPKTQRNARLADTVVRMLDTAIIAESINPVTANTAGSGAGMTATYQQRYNQPAMENQGWAATYNESDDYIEEKWSAKYKRSINCANPRGFSQRAHCAGRRKNEDVAEAFGPLPKDNQQIRLGRHTVDIERVGLNNNYIGFTWHDSQGQEHYEEVAVGDLGSYDNLIEKIKQEISYQERQYTDQGVAEGSDAPYWRVEQSEATGRYYVVTGYTDKSRKVWKNKLGAADFNKKADAEAKANELNQGMAEGDDNFGKPAAMMQPSAAAAKTAQNIVQKQADQNVIGMAKFAGAVPAQGVAEAQLAEKCWDTHRQAGMKKKGNRMVPDCVPK